MWRLPAGLRLKEQRRPQQKRDRGGLELARQWAKRQPTARPVPLSLAGVVRQQGDLDSVIEFELFEYP